MTNSQPPTSTAPLLSGLNHVAVITADLDRLVTFYREVFGAEAIDVPSPPGTTTKIVRLGPTGGLAVMEAPDNPYARGSTQMLGRGHLDHFALEVPSAEALDMVRARLVLRNASNGEIQDYGPMLAVYFEDPDGTGCEICWVRDRSLTGGHEPRVLRNALATVAG
jgi:catechol 2,3-dioxygenase-like lactoylglutathione lyase family enzyme